MGQTDYNRFRYEIGATHNKLNQNYDDGMFNFSDVENVGFRVAAHYYISPSFNASLSVSRGKLKHENEFFALITDVTTRLKYKFNNGYIMPEDAFFAPYIAAGFGISNLQDQEYFYDEYDGTHAIVPIAVGFDLKINDKTDLVTQATYKNSIDDTYSYLQYNIGVKFSFQRDKDKDGDGVIDRNDACPDEAGPSTNNGCPLADDDNDGFPNINDACPNVAGTINGCPDSDGDLVPDIYDACPNVAGKAELGGCPDSDNDGVVDSQDPCPNTYGTINGCTEAAVQAMVPNSTKDAQFKLIEAAENILFEFDKATLTAGSYDALDDILKVLQENPTIKLDINGHADSTGSPEYNLRLSERRAQTVKDYFTSKGIAANRLESAGFGERAPRTGNSTSGERALNRRVDIDFVINN
jgi:outer membrane protein OmpA-like peptidoglycan-associated protein